MLNERMTRYAASMEFEKAQQIKERIEVLNKHQSKSQVDATNQAISIAHRPVMFDLIRRQQLNIHTDGAGDTRILAIFVHAVLC